MQNKEVNGHSGRQRMLSNRNTSPCDQVKLKTLDENVAQYDPTNLPVRPHQYRVPAPPRNPDHPHREGPPRHLTAYHQNASTTNHP